MTAERDSMTLNEVSYSALGAEDHHPSMIDDTSASASLRVGQFYACLATARSGSIAHDETRSANR